MIYQALYIECLIQFSRTCWGISPFKNEGSVDTTLTFYRDFEFYFIWKYRLPALFFWKYVVSDTLRKKLKSYNYKFQLGKYKNVH